MKRRLIGLTLIALGGVVPATGGTGPLTAPAPAVACNGKDSGERARPQPSHIKCPKPENDEGKATTRVPKRTLIPLAPAD